MRTQHSKSQLRLNLEPDDLDTALRNLDWKAYCKPAVWLQGHVPSVAFLKCIGSGPWKIGRRTTVQTDLLRQLKLFSIRLELTETRAAEYNVPLEWQGNYIQAAIKSCRDNDSTFNGTFNVPVTSPETLRARFVETFGPLDKASKVLLLFARDYLMLPDAFPIDRHVRTWMNGVGLKRKSSSAVVKLFQERGVMPAAVSRAIFGIQSENPVHAL